MSGSGPKEGDPAPDFAMKASGGREVSLGSLKGAPFLLYFYPKADTPGCTKQACGIQEALPQLGKLELEVVGVSPDSVPAIEKFAKKFGLDFPSPPTPTRRGPQPTGPGSRRACTERGTWAWSGAASWWTRTAGSRGCGAR